MSVIPQATIEQVRHASDIVDVISSYLPLKRAGTNFLGLCPFHKEKTPSFSVSPSKQIFHCFGCGKGGDVFTFLREFENLSFIESVQRLGERARIPVEFEMTPGQREESSLKELLRNLHEQVAQHWETILNNDARARVAREYLVKRGISDEAVKRFRIGYAPDAWNDTVNWAKSRKHDNSLLEKGGLAIAGNKGHYDRFRGRLIFPIGDEQGRVIGFSGRVLSTEQKGGKYINSPETPIFSKRRVIYSIDKSKRSILDAKSVIVCEGQLDTIACHLAGIENAVSPQGTALTGDQARILKRYAEEVVLCFDSDTAGQQAALRSLDDLLASDLAIRVAVIPKPHDPDSFIRENGAESFKQLIDEAPGFFDFLLSHLCHTHDTNSDRGRIKIVHEMRDAVQKTDNPVLIDTHAQKVSRRLGVDTNAVRIEFKKGKRSFQPQEPEYEEPPLSQGTTTRPTPIEFWLLKLALNEHDSIEWLETHLDLDWIAHPAVREILQQQFALNAENSGAGMPDLLAKLEADAFQHLATEAVADGRTIPNPTQQLHDIVLRLRNQFIKSRLAGIQRELPGAGDELLSKLLTEREQLKKLTRHPLEPLAGA
ncbi:MAG: DNA primase [Verrucomicrobiota bacterium]|nr:DNA primase [Verrucomicrobiota bacterium]